MQDSSFCIIFYVPTVMVLPNRLYLARW